MITRASVRRYSCLHSRSAGALKLPAPNSIRPGQSQLGGASNLFGTRLLPETPRTRDARCRSTQSQGAKCQSFAFSKGPIPGWTIDDLCGLHPPIRSPRSMRAVTCWLPAAVPQRLDCSARREKQKDIEVGGVKHDRRRCRSAANATVNSQ